MTRVHAALAAILLIADARGQRVETCAGDCLDGITIFAPHDGTIVCVCCLSQVQVARCDYLHYNCRPLGASTGNDYFRIVRAPDWPFCLEPASILPPCTFQRPAPAFDFSTSSEGRTPSDPGGDGGGRGNINPADGEAAHATRDKLIGAAAGGALGGAILLAALATLCIRRCRRKQSQEQRAGDPNTADDDNDNQTIPSFGFRGNGEDYDPFSAPQPSPFPRPRGASNPYLPEAAETESRDGDDTVYPAYSVSPTLRTTSNTPLGLQKWSDLPKLPKFDFEDP